MRTKRFPDFGNYLLSKIGRTTEASIANVCGVTQPAVSAWLNGYARPGPNELINLVSNYDLDIQKVIALTGYPINKITQLYKNQAVPPEDIEALRIVLKLIHQLRTEGNPKGALDQAKKAENVFTVKANKTHSSTSYSELRNLQGLLLYEQRIAFHEIALPDQQMLTYTKQITQQLESIEKDCQNPIFPGLIELCWGDTHYMMGRSREAIRRLSIANLHFAHIKDVDQQLDTLRLLALSDARQRKEGKKKVIDHHNKMRRLIDGGKWTNKELVFQALEGLGRSFGLVGLDQAHQVFDEAKGLGVESPFRQIQLVRSELIVTQYLKTMNKSTIEQLGKDALSLAKNKWPRHANQIRKLLMEHLN